MTLPARILDRPYSERQLILVTEDALANAAQNAELEALQENRSVNWSKIAEISMKVIFGGLVTEVAVEAAKAWGRARSNGIQIEQVGRTESQGISFPPGHPREGVLYIGHPALPNVYYTTAAFHRVTFEHKFAEAVDLLMHLGATKLRVEHVRGWSRELSSRLTVPLGELGSSVGGEAGASSVSGTKLLYEAVLSGALEPRLPDKLVWYPHESTWQSVAKGRIDFGLQSFSLSVSYEDDFGVNAGLKVGVVKAGLELGGQFEDHESTVWRLAGEF